MPRTARAIVGGYCYHVLNRGNARSQVFHHEGDYARFVELMHQASARLPMRALAYCLMPNHFHLAVWPEGDQDLSDWMHWLMTAQVRGYRQHYGGNGHIWQARSKACPIQEDAHLLTVLRSIECNPLRAALVAQAQDWPWSSLQARLKAALIPLLHPGPVPLPPGWVDHVNALLHDKDRKRKRHSLRRGTPFGRDGWVEATACRLGLQETLRPLAGPVRPPTPRTRPPVRRRAYSTDNDSKGLRNVPVSPVSCSVSCRSSLNEQAACVRATVDPGCRGSRGYRSVFKRSVDAGQ
jgi:putative transposase